MRVKQMERLNSPLVGTGARKESDMGPAYFVLAILGCGEGDAPCRQVAVTPMTYASQSACMSATGSAVEKYQDAPYPVVVAQCRSAKSTIAQELRPGDIMLPEVDGEVEQAPRPRIAESRKGEKPA
jgi:hypothetical protein